MDKGHSFCTLILLVFFILPGTIMANFMAEDLR